ncbi:hypothetical protein WJX73_006929 [Symbiochloris irregularis]|uniref:Protein kinase domain-containing protein n=1 Tax=Symbiochloris irregularis TaxID=706552 RepID=A0AAW1NVJ2_9CHLO
MVQTEACLTRAAWTPNTVQVYAVVADRDGEPLHNSFTKLLLEGLKGPTLHKLLSDRGGPLPMGEAMEKFAGIAEALRPLHARGIYHLNISPGNILIVDGVVKLSDFSQSFCRSWRYSRFEDDTYDTGRRYVFCWHA